MTGHLKLHPPCTYHHFVVYIDIGTIPVKRSHITSVCTAPSDTISILVRYQSSDTVSTRYIPPRVIPYRYWYRITSSGSYWLSIDHTWVIPYRYWYHTASSDTIPAQYIPLVRSRIDIELRSLDAVYTRSACTAFEWYRINIDMVSLEWYHTDSVYTD